MCELACQAYEGEENGERWFRFPPWVQLGIQQDHSQILSHGMGALVIDDPLRIDVEQAIRTQDFAELKPDGKFGLLGRIPNVVLKGCSLKCGGASAKKTSFICEENFVFREPKALGIHRANINSTIENWLCSKETLEQLLRFSTPKQSVIGLLLT